MALDFPDNPQIGDVWQSGEGISYVCAAFDTDGSALWVVRGGGGTNEFYRLDGSLPLEGDMDAAGYAITDVDLNGGDISEELVRVRVPRSGASGAMPAVTDSGSEGAISVNLPDAKVYAKDASGAPVIVSDRIKLYSDQRHYVVGDSVYHSLDGNTLNLYRCLVDVDAPEAFDTAKWQPIASPPSMRVPFEAWGAVADYDRVALTGTDNSAALAQALYDCSEQGLTLDLSGGIYYIETPVVPVGHPLSGTDPMYVGALGEASTWGIVGDSYLSSGIATGESMSGQIAIRMKRSVQNQRGFIKDVGFFNHIHKTEFAGAPVKNLLHWDCIWEINDNPNPGEGEAYPDSTAGQSHSALIQNVYFGYPDKSHWGNRCCVDEPLVMRYHRWPWVQNINIQTNMDWQDDASALGNPGGDPAVDPGFSDPDGPFAGKPFYPPYFRKGAAIRFQDSYGPALHGVRISHHSEIGIHFTSNIYQTGGTGHADVEQVGVTDFLIVGFPHTAYVVDHRGRPTTEDNLQEPEAKFTGGVLAHIHPMCRAFDFRNHSVISVDTVNPSLNCDAKSALTTLDDPALKTGQVYFDLQNCHAVTINGQIGMPAGGYYNSDEDATVYFKCDEFCQDIHIADNTLSGRGIGLQWEGQWGQLTYVDNARSNRIGGSNGNFEEYDVDIQLGSVMPYGAKIETHRDDNGARSLPNLFSVNDLSKTSGLWIVVPDTTTELAGWRAKRADLYDYPGHLPGRTHGLRCELQRGLVEAPMVRDQLIDNPLFRVKFNINVNELIAGDAITVESYSKTGNVLGRRRNVLVWDADSPPTTTRSGWVTCIVDIEVEADDIRVYPDLGNSSFGGYHIAIGANFSGRPNNTFVMDAAECTVAPPGATEGVISVLDSTTPWFDAYIAHPSGTAGTPYTALMPKVHFTTTKPTILVKGPSGDAVFAGEYTLVAGETDIWEVVGGISFTPDVQSFWRIEVVADNPDTGRRNVQQNQAFMAAAPLGGAAPVVVMPELRAGGVAILDIIPQAGLQALLSVPGGNRLLDISSNLSVYRSDVTFEEGGDPYQPPVVPGQTRLYIPPNAAGGSLVLNSYQGKALIKSEVYDVV